MTVYSAPVQEILFSLFDVNDFGPNYAQAGLNKEDVTAILETAGKFAEEVLFPLSASADEEGLKFENGEVITPKGYKEAYQQYVDGGWSSIAQPEEYGGQGLPYSLSNAIGELHHTAEASWTTYLTLGAGSVATLLEYGTDEQKNLYLPKLVSAEWTGTMCLTEPQAGSDLGLLRTRAEPMGDGQYKITGNKIYISVGEHDLSENIIHLVLARLPDAPKGVRGISLFVVPKFKVNADGSLGERNNVSCGGIEQKLGLTANATCSMNFDGAEGFLVGPPNKGLACMFTFINTSRIGVAVQGYGQAEGAYQMSLAHAQDRLQGRAPGGAKYPEQDADPIIEHPDVQRMLMTQKVFAEGGRTLVHHCSKLVDQTKSGDQSQIDYAEKLLSVLTPIAKGCLSEWGYEACDLGIQVFGGAGYLKGSGVERRLRDIRIARIYEGTTGIQSIDLLKRKILPDGGQALQLYIDDMESLIADCQNVDALSAYCAKLEQSITEWKSLNETLIQRMNDQSGLLESIAFDYFMYSGYIVLSYQWLRIANAAFNVSEHKAADWLEEKVTAMQFCFNRILPRGGYHKTIIENLLES